MAQGVAGDEPPIVVGDAAWMDRPENGSLNLKLFDIDIWYIWDIDIDIDIDIDVWYTCWGYRCYLGLAMLWFIYIFMDSDN